MAFASNADWLIGVGGGLNRPPARIEQPQNDRELVCLFFHALDDLSKNPGAKVTIPLPQSTRSDRQFVHVETPKAWKEFVMKTYQTPITTVPLISPAGIADQKHGLFGPITEDAE